MMDGVRRQHALALVVIVPASIQVALEARKITAGDLDPDAMSCCEGVTGDQRTYVDFDHTIRLAGTMGSPTRLANARAVCSHQDCMRCRQDRHQAT